MTVQANLCRTWSETKLLVFSREGSNASIIEQSRQRDKIIELSSVEKLKKSFIFPFSNRYSNRFSGIFPHFYTPPLKKVRGIMLYPPKKICVRVSVRPSVRPSVCLSVCPSVRPSAFRFRALSCTFIDRFSSNFV